MWVFFCSWIFNSEAHPVQKPLEVGGYNVRGAGYADRGRAITVNPRLELYTEKLSWKLVA